MGAPFKEELRLNIRNKFSQWSDREKNEADAKILSKLKLRLSDFSSNWKLQYGELPILGLYLPLKHEPDVLEILDWNLSRPSFPIMKNKELHIMEYCYFKGKKSELTASGYFFKTDDRRICEPDVILVPGLAFDFKGYRLGQGKGYFDLYLAQHECLSIGLCYSWQMQEKIGAQNHDKKMHMVITEDEILQLKKNEFL